MALRNRSFARLLSSYSKMGVSPEKPTQVAAAILVTLDEPFRKRASSHQLVVYCQMRPTPRAILRACYVLPATVAQKAGVPTRDQRRAILERCSISGFDARPVRKNSRFRVARIEPMPPPSID